MENMWDKVYIGSWKVIINVDSDGHLNIYLENLNDSIINEIESGQGDGLFEQLALRFTTPRIEALSEQE